MISKVLIGITTKNRESILPKAIESALSQDYTNKEIIIFDDASTDNTDFLQNRFKNVKWINSKESKGLLYARNLFLEMTSAVYFCSLDDDAWFLKKDAITIGVAYMEKNPTVAVVGYDMLSPECPEIKQDNIEACLSNNFIGCGHLLRIQQVKIVGKYIPLPGFYGSEEKDLVIRLMDFGFEIVKLKGLYVWHDKTNISRNLFLQHRSGVCNDLVFMLRRTPIIFLIPSFFAKILKHLIFSIKSKDDKMFKAFLNGILDFIIFIFKEKVNRKPVKISTFKNYLSFN